MTSLRPAFTFGQQLFLRHSSLLSPHPSTTPAPSSFSSCAHSVQKLRLRRAPFSTIPKPLLSAAGAVTLWNHSRSPSLGSLINCPSCRHFSAPNAVGSQEQEEKKGSSLTEMSGGSLAGQALVMKKAASGSQEGQEQQGPEDEEAKKAAENQVRALKYTMYVMGGMIVGTSAYIYLNHGAPTIDHEGKVIRDEFSDLPLPIQYWKRAGAEVNNYIKYIVNPSRDKLLPDPVKPPYHQPPYTVLIELNGVLVHPEWTYKTGWRFKKRPGVDYFLRSLAGYHFELVIYTHEPGMIAFPIVEALDQGGQGYFHYRLFRDSTKYEDGVHLKDLDKLNRNLSKVILIDCNEKAVGHNRTNALVLPKWNGNDDDRALIDLASLIQTIGNSGVEDVRVVLDYYAKYPDPVEEFRTKQMELAKQEDALKKSDKKPGTGGVAGTFSNAGNVIGSLFRKS